MIEGSALLFLDGPKNRLEFSLNGVFGKALEKFDGFYGLKAEEMHLISYRLGTSDTNGEGAFTSLFLRTSSNPRIFIFEWSEAEELYKIKACEPQTDDFAVRILQYPGMISMQRFMNQEAGSEGAWRIFTAGINGEVVERVFKNVCLEYGAFQITPMTGSHHSLLDTSKLPNNTESFDLENLNFTIVPTLKDFSRTNPKMATECAMDRSPILNHLLEQVSIESLLAELKLSFLLLTFAQNFEGFEQWLAIVELFCKSFRTAFENVSIYIKFLRILQDHLSLCPDDFFSGLLSENKLFCLLDELFRNGPVEFWIFKSFYEEKFGWIFNEAGFEGDEDAPVIVEE